METIYLAGGCFWGVEHFFDQFEGIHTEVGYANGKTENPSYEEVCRFNTDHAECVKVSFDKNQYSLAQILYGYLAIIDPFSINRQGNDIGRQYRTGIYYSDPEQKLVAKVMVDWLERKYNKKAEVEIVPLENFYTAEEYHQKYLDKNPGGYCHIPQSYFHVTLPSQKSIYEQIPQLKSVME